MSDYVEVGGKYYELTWRGCPNCGAEPRVRVYDITTKMVCACGWRGTFAECWHVQAGAK